MLIIPNEGELFPEWRIMFIIAYPGEDNFYQVEITPDDIKDIIKADRWIIIDNQHFNKDMCESFRFITQIKDGNNWKTYSPELATEILKRELEEEMKNQIPDGIAQGVLPLGGFHSLIASNSNSSEDALKQITISKNKDKTGR